MALLAAQRVVCELLGPVKPGIKMRFGRSDTHLLTPGVLIGLFSPLLS